jgi:hypothetical protein
LLHIVAELRRRHARVAAELVDLIRGGLDQDGVVVQRHLHGGAQHARVAAADAVHAGRFASAVGGDDLLDGESGVRFFTN